MENLDKKTVQISQKEAKRRKWRRIAAVPAAIVVFFTTYVLILPAFTQSHETYCGMEEHMHTEECYVAPLSCGHDEGEAVIETTSYTYFECTEEIHRHTSTCYNRDHEVICGYADFVVHKHDSN